MPEPIEGSKSYIPSLDGIRALAVLAVICYHLGYGWAQGGLLGVDVFFVLSGYLITDLLLSEHRKNGFIRLKSFWLRRARRLLPALFVMLFIVLGWVTLFNQAQLPQVKSDLLPATFYYSNWWFIFEHVSYFAKFGPPSPLGHLWSLAIEEQFYLIWPLIIILTLKITKSKKVLGIITCMGIVASACEMAVLYQPYVDPTRLYDGTDTRAFALLLGALLAIYRPRDKKIAISQNSLLWVNTVGIAALIGLLLMFWQTDEYSAFLYQGGMLLTSVLSALMIIIAVIPDTYLAKSLSNPILKWIGQRSYGIYLWHYPIITLTTPYNSQPNLLRSILQVAVSFACAALSWEYIEEPIRHGGLSRFWNNYQNTQNYKLQLAAVKKILFGEQPLVNTNISSGLETMLPSSDSPEEPQRIFKKSKQLITDRNQNHKMSEEKPATTRTVPPQDSIKPKQVLLSFVTLAVTSNFVVCLLAVSGILTGSAIPNYSGEGNHPISILPTPHTLHHVNRKNQDYSTNLVADIQSNMQIVDYDFLTTLKTVRDIPFMCPEAKTYAMEKIEERFFFDQYRFSLPWLFNVNVSASNLPPYILEKKTPSAVNDDSGIGVTAIGDSIMIDAAPYLKQYLPGMTIDAIVGQQIWQVQSDVPKLRQEGAIGNRLIIELGTNGGYTQGELLQLIDSLGHMKKIVLVNALVPDPWESEVNSSIASVARTLPNVTIVNWYEIGQKHPNYFYPDHIHLNPVGAKFYAKLIVRALRKS